MYPIRLITVGRSKLEGCEALAGHYKNLLRSYARLDVIEIAEGKGEGARQLKDEADRLRPLLAVARPVLLDADGPPRSSEAFAKWLGQCMDRGEGIAFAIGSSHGFDPALKTAIPDKLSLSPMTFPHDLSRVMFLEQLYRAFAILRGKTYHK